MYFNSTKTHCKNGHKFTEENIYTPPGTNKRVCRKCRTNAVEEYNRKHRLEKNARRRLWRATVQTKAMRRKDNLRNIGWTPELFSKRLKEQKGKCAVCKKKLTFENRISGSRACADHEHVKPPVPRGVLCANCNLGIGNLQDDPKILRSAIKYLGKFTRR